MAATVVEQIDRLGENPRLGVRIANGPLEGRMLYAFVVESDPRVYRLGVLYLFMDNEVSIFISELGILRSDGSRLHLAEFWPPPE